LHAAGTGDGAAQLPTNNYGISVTPSIVTHCTPYARVVNFDTAAPICSACRKADVVKGRLWGVDGRREVGGAASLAAHTHVLVVHAVMVRPATVLAPGELGLKTGALDVIHPNDAIAPPECLELHSSLRHVAESATHNLSIYFREPVVANTAINAVMVDLDTARLGSTRNHAYDSIVAARAVEFNGVRRVRELNSGATITAHTNIFTVNTVVVAPGRLGAMGDF